MTVTANAYIDDSGELIQTVTADMVTAITELSTAEDITANCVRQFATPTRPTRTTRSKRVTTGRLSATTAQDGHYEHDLTIVDDWSADFDGGEHGTDNISLYQLYWLAFQAEVAIGPLKVTPAGSDAGMTQWSLGGAIHVLDCPPPNVNADAQEENEVTIRLRLADNDAC